MRSLLLSGLIVTLAGLAGCSVSYREPAAGYYYSRPGYTYYDRYPHYYSRNYYSQPAVRVRVEHHDDNWHHDRDHRWANDRY